MEFITQTEVMDTAREFGKALADFAKSAGQSKRHSRLFRRIGEEGDFYSIPIVNCMANFQLGWFQVWL